MSWAWNLHVGKIVEVKGIYLCIIRKIKVLDELLYLGIQIHRSPVVVKNATIYTLISEQQLSWYVETTPFFLSHHMLEKLETRDTIDSDIVNALATDNTFLINVVNLLGEIAIPIAARKYPREQCVQAYNRAMREQVL